MDTLITQASDIPSIAAKLAKTKLWAVDLETLGFDAYLGKIRILSISDGLTTWVIDVFKTGRPDAILDLMTSRVVVGCGLKFDCKWMMHEWGIELGRMFDVFAASNLLYNGELKGHNLWDVLKRELDVDPATADLGASDWSGTLTEEQIQYAGDDVRHMHRLREVLLAKLQAKGLTQVMGIEMGAITPVAAMELNGMPVDTGMWLSLAEDNAIRKKACESDLMAVLPDVDNQLDMFGSRTLNLDSPVQLLQSLRKYGLPVTSTAEAELSIIDHPIIDKVLAYRGYGQRVKSFGVDWLEHVHPVTRRVHSSYYPFSGAGRFNNSSPNLSQIPRTADFRGCFRVGEEKRIILADYSAVEMRVCAEITGDEQMRNVFRSGADPHTATAALMMGIPQAEVTGSQRQMAKAVNFCLIFSGGAERLKAYAKQSYGVTMTLQEAQGFKDKFFHGYPQVAEWHREIFSDVHKRIGEARGLDGRYRKLAHDDHGAYANTPIQSSAASGLKAALALVHKRIRNAKLIHICHDEILLEADASEDCESIKAALESCMVDGLQPLMPNTPVEAKGAVGASWASK